MTSRVLAILYGSSIVTNRAVTRPDSWTQVGWKKILKVVVVVIKQISQTVKRIFLLQVGDGFSIIYFKYEKEYDLIWYPRLIK